MRTAIALSLFILAFTSCKENSKTDKKEPTGDEKVTITSDGVNIAYNKCGNGDTTLLFVHGWCINKTYWEEQLKSFCPRYTVVAIDLPGFGESGKNRTAWTFDAYTNDIKNVIEQLKLKNVVLIGHSMSGDIVLKADNSYPSLLAGIVGIDNLHAPGRPATADEKKQYDEFFKELSGAFDSTTNKNMTKGLFSASTPDSVKQRVMGDVFNVDSTIAIAVLKDLILTSESEQPLMQGLSHKLFVVNSDVNPIVTDSMNKYCRKGFHAELVPGTGHYPMIEKTDMFNKALQRVLDALDN